MAKNLEAYKLGVVIDANAAATLRTFAQTDKAASGLEKRFKSLRATGESIARLGVGWAATVSAPLGLIGKSAINAAVAYDKLRTTLTALEGDAGTAARKLAELREISASSAGVLSSVAIEQYAQLRAIGNISEDAINQVIKATGKLNAVFSLDDAKGFSRNLVQIFTQGFERTDVKEAIGRVPIFEQLLESAFGTKDAEKLRKLKTSGKLTLDSYLSGLSNAVQNNPKLAGIQDSIGATFAKTNERIEQALIPLGEVLLKAIIPAVNVVVPAIERFSQAFAQLSPTTQAVAVGMGALAVAAGPVLIGLGAITAAIGALGAPAVAAIGVLTAASAALATAWATNFGGIREVTAQVFTEIKTVATEQGKVLVDWWKENLPLIKQTVQTVLNGVKAFWQRHGAEITAIVKTSWQLLSTTVGTLIKTILGVIKLGMQVINGDWAGAWKTLQATAQAAVGGVVKIVMLFARRVNEVIKFGISALLDLNGWIRGKMVELGFAIVQGVVQGVKNKSIQLYDTVRNLANEAYRSAKDALGIRSPSRLFAEIGRDVVAGFILGIRLKEADVKKVLKDLLIEATATAKAIAGLSDLRIFTTRNRATDLQEQLDRAEELFKMRRELGTIPNAPNTPISGALPQGDAAIQQQIAYIAALKGLSEAIARVPNIGLAIDLPESDVDIPDVIKSTTDALNEQIRVGTQAADTYADLKRQLEGIIESYQDLTATQRLQKRFGDLPADAPPQQRAELESLFSQARKAEINDEFQKAQAKKRETPGFFDRIGGLFGGRSDDGLGIGKISSATSGIKAALGELKTLGAEAFGTLAQGIGSLIENWVIMGDAGPDALRKMTAAILAAAARESAVLAIIETAKGFATMFTHPARSAGHFTAAAIFAGVAGGTAIAGRAVAGNAFNGRNQQSNPYEAGLNRDITSEAYSGNRFNRTDRLLEQINNKLQPVNGDTLVVGAIKKNAREIGRAAVDAVNGDFALGMRLNARAA